ncbi:heterokaryon incompatibility protein-domain-containing protein, partial [Lasiosphaeris hirsuta]
LSYVWGDPNDRVRVRINNSKVDLTRNLYNALVQIRDWRSSCESPGGAPDSTPPEPTPIALPLARVEWLWVDAICINQDDGVEKSKQVTRMGEIYGTAAQVVGWLGLPSPGIEDLGYELRRISSRVPDPVGLDIFRYRFADDIGADNFGQFGKAFADIVKREWFKRIWIVQESVLAKSEPILCVGRH